MTVLRIYYPPEGISLVDLPAWGSPLTSLGMVFQGPRPAELDRMHKAGDIRCVQMEKPYPPFVQTQMLRMSGVVFGLTHDETTAGLAEYRNTP